MILSVVLLVLEFERNYIGLSAKKGFVGGFQGLLP